jgi:hypothetical protein
MRRARYEITTCFHKSTKTVNEVQNESVKYIIELVRKRVVTRYGTNSNVNVADSDATVVRSVAILLNVVKLMRLDKRKQPAIGVSEIIVDKDVFINSWRCIALLIIEQRRPRLMQTIVRSKQAHRGKPRRAAPAPLTLIKFMNDRDTV